MYFLALGQLMGGKFIALFQPHCQERELIINSGGRLMEFQLGNLLMWFLKGKRKRVGI